jgi:hypothetical protein
MKNILSFNKLIRFRERSLILKKEHLILVNELTTRERKADNRLFHVDWGVESSNNTQFIL